MKVAESLLLACVVGLACFIGGQTLGLRHGIVNNVSAGAIAYAPSTSADDIATNQSFGTTSPVARMSTAAPDVNRPARSMSGRDLRQRIAQGAGGTYIAELLAERDSAITRWPDRVSHPLRVWIADAERVRGWNADFAPSVRDAFQAWVTVGIPIRFDFIADSASADVHVRFIERFPNGISGKTVWSRDVSWWLVSSEIELALSHPNGGTVTAPQMRAIAMHEVGHLLGLDHSRTSDDIMAAHVHVRELSEADRATVRLLYSVPAGSTRN